MKVRVHFGMVWNQGYHGLVNGGWFDYNTDKVVLDTNWKETPILNVRPHCRYYFNGVLMPITKVEVLQG